MKTTKNSVVIEIAVMNGHWHAWYNGLNVATPWTETVDISYVAAELTKASPGCVVRPLATPSEADVERMDDIAHRYYRVVEEWAMVNRVAAMIAADAIRSQPTMRERWAAAWSEWRGLYDRRISALGHIAAQYGLPHRALAEAVMRADMLAHRMPGRLLNWPKGWRNV